jgi:DNA-binding Lrp family transcriptional regulator
MGIFNLKSRIARLRDKRIDQAPENGKACYHFDDRQRKEAAFDSRARGIRTVPLERVMGSVGRYQDFDDRFRFRSLGPSERLQRIRAAMREGRPLPPVVLYQIKDEYYVVDGNHRVAAAKELGHDEILAEIIEFIPSLPTLQNMLFRERADFLDRTRLKVDIQLTEVGQYVHLLKQIEDHRAYLQQQLSAPASFQAAAQDWYKTIYKPLCTIIRGGQLLDTLPARNLADLYTYISTHQWKTGRRRQYGSGIDKMIPKDMEAFRKKMMAVKNGDYPDMRRDITAFVLMNVEGKKEFKVVDKIYELEEVREVHSVHGDIDILIKIVLSRDLLSSDAEVISQFVHEKIRQLPGVISTKTLIPGYSKIKDSPDTVAQRRA